MRSRPWLAALGTVLALSTATGVAWSAPAPKADAGLGIRLLDAPAARRDDPRARVYIVDFVHPGTTIVRHVEVSNGGDAPRHVDLYPDAAHVSGGAFVVASGHTGNELSSWITVSPTSLELPARGTGTATVTVTVPQDAAPGERYGVVLADIPAAPGEGLLTSSRVGIRTYLSVGPGAEPASNLTVDTLTAARDATGAPVVRAQVHNTGGRALDLQGSLKLSAGPGGLSAGPFTANLGSTLAPGDSQPVTVTLDKALPAGPWTAQIDIQSGTLNRSATATLTFPTDPGMVAPPVLARAVPLPKEFPVAASVAAALIVATVFTLLGALVRRRRRRSL